MNRILITGVTGFVGRSLVSYFHEKEGLRLFAHSRNAQKAREAFSDFKVEIVPEIHAELLNNYKIDTVIHLAGIAHDLSGNFKEQDYVEGNVENTKRIYDQFAQSEASTFIFMSSIKAVTDHTDDLIDEAFAPEPKTPYGKSKLWAEQYLNEHPANGKRVVILRPCMIHGPGNKGNLNLLYQFVKKGIPYPLAAFDNRRSFLSIGNLCFAVEKIIQTPGCRGTFHIADDEAISTTELVKIIGKCTGKSPKMVKIPVALIKSIATVGSALHLPFNKATLGKLTESMAVSNRRLLLTLNTEFPIPTREGLMLTIKSLNG
ncbi:MAG: NAD-dependent epimerase/dehydratase family protein [Cyclobacteriaceae bacterium]|nr:NAD-dependent epimerase/dehydratase family protein [Cyclobacteriaceae bacterium]